MDGAASQDSGNLNTGYISPSVDAIGEVKLLVSNYTAEYGGRTAGQLTVTTKNGTPQFHGTAYYYYRHESLNANEFFNNKTNVVQAALPLSESRRHRRRPADHSGHQLQQEPAEAVLLLLLRQAVQQHRPTLPPTPCPRRWRSRAISRKTVTTTGVADPDLRSDHAERRFPGNIIPANRISPQRQAMLNLFPLPDPAGPGARSHGQPRIQLPLSRSSSCGRWMTRSCAWTTTSRRRCRSTRACCRITRRRTATT